MAIHTYVVISIPPGCAEYEVDQEVQLFVEEPPPQTKTIGEDECEGVEVELVS